MTSCLTTSAILCFGLLAISSDHCLAAEANDASGGYVPAFRDKTFDVILGRVVAAERRGRFGVVYRVSVLADMRAVLKAGVTISIEGGDAGTINPMNNIPNFNAQSVALFPTKKTAEPTRWTYSRFDDLPIGHDASKPVPAANVPEVAAALEELRNALASPGVPGPSRERIGELLHQKNFYLWALGAWRLSKDADLLDQERLKALFGRPGLTPAQALWLDGLFDGLMGPASDYHLTDTDHYNLLRSFLAEYVKDRESTAPTTQPTK